MQSKIFFLAIFILATRTHLASSMDDEDTTTEFTTEGTTETFFSTTMKTCPHHEKPAPASEKSSEVDDRLTLENLANKLMQVQEIVSDNKAMLSKLRRVPHHDNYPKHCLELKQQGHNVSDVYFIKPKYSPEPFLVFCDMVTEGGGWTTLLSRVDGTLNFDQDWKNYKHGFGRLRHEFWLGLEKIHYLTGSEINELLIQVNEWGPKEAYFSSFSIGNEDEDFSIKLLDGYRGDTGSNLIDSYGAKFSTKDKSLDASNMKCAILSGGGWWHKNCGSTILTSKWTVYNVMSWQHAKMMVRPR